MSLTVKIAALLAFAGVVTACQQEPEPAPPPPPPVIEEEPTFSKF